MEEPRRSDRWLQLVEAISAGHRPDASVGNLPRVAALRSAVVGTAAPPALLDAIERVLMDGDAPGHEVLETVHAALPPSDPLRAYVALYRLRLGGASDEPGLRAEIRAAVPDSVYVAWREFEDLERAGDLAGALRALDRIDLRPSGRPAAVLEFDRRVAPVLARMGRELGPWAVHRARVRLLMQLRRTEEALPVARAWAEEVGPVDPPWLPSLQVGFLLTALRRHAEAVEAYGEAIERVLASSGLVVVRDDLRALAWFNRACERAVQGERGPGVLEDLREAVRRNPALAEEARREEYLAELRSDPGFEATLVDTLERSGADA